MADEKHISTGKYKILVENKTDYAALVKNTVNTLVAYTNNMNL